MGYAGFGGEFPQGLPLNPPNYPPMSYYFPPIMPFVLYPQLQIQSSPLEASPYAHYIPPPYPVLSPIPEEDEEEVAAEEGYETAEVSYGYGEEDQFMMPPTSPYFMTYFFQPMMMGYINMPYVYYTQGDYMTQDDYLAYGQEQPTLEFEQPEFSAEVDGQGELTPPPMCPPEYSAEVEAHGESTPSMCPSVIDSTGIPYEDPRGPFCKYTAFKPRTFQARKGKKKGKVTPRPCGFCKSNRQEAKIYRSHTLLDKFGNTVCPLLQALVCNVCGGTGKQAHTLGFCPIMKKRRESNIFRPSNGQ